MANIKTALTLDNKDFLRKIKESEAAAKKLGIASEQGSQRAARGMKEVENSAQKTASQLNRTSAVATAAGTNMRRSMDGAASSVNKLFSGLGSKIRELTSIQSALAPIKQQFASLLAPIAGLGIATGAVTKTINVMGETARQSASGMAEALGAAGAAAGAFGLKSAQAARVSSDSAKKALADYIRLQEAYKAAMSKGPPRAARGSALATERSELRTQRDQAFGALKSAVGGNTGLAVSMVRGAASAGLLTGALVGLKAIAGPLTAGVGALAVTMGLLGSSAAAAAEEQSTMARIFGISARELEAYKVLANSNGTTVEALVRTYDKLAKSMNKLDEENEQAEQAFGALGLSIKDVANLSTQEVAGKIIANWEALGRTTQATAAAAQLLGPNFREQIPAIVDATTSFDGYLERIDKFGTVASESLVRAGDEQEAALEDLKLAWAGLKNEIGETTSGMVTWLANAAASGLNSLRKLIGGVNAATKDVIRLSNGQTIEQSGVQGGRGTVIPPLAGEKKSVTPIKTMSTEAKKVADEFQRVQESLRRQVELTNNATEEEKVRYEITRGAYREFNDSQKQALIDLARQLDLRAELQRSADRQLESIRRYEEAEAAINEELERRKGLQEEILAAGRANIIGVGKKVSDDISFKKRSVGMSSAQREELEAIDAVAAETARSIAELDKEMVGYQQRVEELKRAEQQAVKIIQDSTQEKIKYQQDWTNGAKNAIADFVDNAQNVAAATEQAMTNAFNGISDAITQLVMTGKANFKDLARSILADFVKIQANRLLSSIILGAGGGTMSSLFAGFFADGGYIPRGKFGIVGENGPEIAYGGQTIVPMDKMGTGSQQNITQVTYQIQAVDAPSFQRLVAADPQFIYAITRKGSQGFKNRR